jgi:hypothetical protein
MQIKMVLATEPADLARLGIVIVMHLNIAGATSLARGRD